MAAELAAESGQSSVPEKIVVENVNEGPQRGGEPDGTGRAQPMLGSPSSSFRVRPAAAARTRYWIT